PNIARHVVKAKTVWRKGLHGARAIETVSARIVIREFTLPGVRWRMLFIARLVTPNVIHLFFPATSGKLPLRLGRHMLARPFGISNRVIPRNLHDGIIVAPLDITVWPLGMSPIGPRRPVPPLWRCALIERNLSTSWQEHQRTGNQIFGRGGRY